MELGFHDFQQGFSVQGGSPDIINNVERIKIAPGTYSNSGDWLVKVMHRGGSDQDYSIVITADATIQPKADLTVFNESIYLSSQNPLQNDIVSLRYLLYTTCPFSSKGALLYEIFPKKTSLSTLITFPFKKFLNEKGKAFSFR